ncbi:hypothetical protein UlMin_038074 [Ulmus minor]
MLLLSSMSSLKIIARNLWPKIDIDNFYNSLCIKRNESQPGRPNKCSDQSKSRVGCPDDKTKKMPKIKCSSGCDPDNNDTNNCHVTELDLSFNQLEGPIPTTFGDFEKDLSYNHLSGSIPGNLGNLKFLRILWLDSNNFIGGLPENFSQLTKLQGFSIEGNNLTGPFPKYITEWPNIMYLMLRNCSINGPIPENIGRMPNLYQLICLKGQSQNGFLPHNLQSISHNIRISKPLWCPFLLIPAWDSEFSFQQGAHDECLYKYRCDSMDLSFNDFSNASLQFDSNNTKLNLFSCCRRCNSANCKAPMYANDLHINCGGEETNLDGIIYESDNDSSPVYTSPHGKNWVRISSGEQSIVKIKCGISVSNAPLYDKARFASVSLKYYGLCLEDGKYNVTLHFAEIVFANNTDEADNTKSDFPYESLKKRIFNINVQNKSVRTDFNIKETAGEVRKDTKVNVPIVQVNNNRLEIHLYWEGKGSSGPFSNNGPLISAISVVPSDIRGKLSPLYVALISVASVVVFVPLLLYIIAWAMGWLRKEEIHEIGVGSSKTVTLKQLMDATRRFSREMEIGRGGLGIVYKAQLPDRQMVAVKKLSTLSSEGIDRLKSESYTLKMLSHENLVQLFDLFIGKDFYLLIYEYMENKSLSSVLFDPMCNIRLSWEARFNICLGIAKGLQYLHEHPRLKMVHRGIKAVNILLDSDLKPKISEFGLASVYAEDGDQEAGQLKIIKSEASHGYMAPEYPLYGTITTKYDVYGFGVVILELVSGKKNAGHNYNQELEYLVDEVCLADSKGRLMDLVDKNLGNSYDQKQAMTLLKFAVKCTHISHILRPSMAQILSVLTGEKTLDRIDEEIANTSSATTKKEDFAESSTSSHI